MHFNLASVPEIVRRLRGPKPRVLDADDLFGRSQNDVRSSGSTKNYVAPFLAISSVDLEAGEREPGDCMIGDAGSGNLQEDVALHLAHRRRSRTMRKRRVRPRSSTRVTLPEAQCRRDGAIAVETTSAYA